MEEGVKVRRDTGSKGYGSANSGGTRWSSADTVVVIKRRRRDVRSGNVGECGDASGDSACVVHCGRFEVDTVEVNLPTLGDEEDGEKCVSDDVEDPGTTSCCSSNESVDLDVKSGAVDASTIQSRYRRERVPRGQAVGTESDENEENNRPKAPAAAAAAVAENSHRIHFQVRMPLLAEIEDFFTSAEKKTVLQFKEKYNFDFEKEEPLRGRYEWKPFPVVAAASAPAKEKEIIKA